jgi:hypothetical protein
MLATMVVLDIIMESQASDYHLNKCKWSTSSNTKEGIGWRWCGRTNPIDHSWNLAIWIQKQLCTTWILGSRIKVENLWPSSYLAQNGKPYMMLANKSTWTFHLKRKHSRTNCGKHWRSWKHGWKHTTVTPFGVSHCITF